MWSVWVPWASWHVLGISSFMSEWWWVFSLTCWDHCKYVGARASWAESPWTSWNIVHLKGASTPVSLEDKRKLTCSFRVTNLLALLGTKFLKVHLINVPCWKVACLRGWVFCHRDIMFSWVRPVRCFKVQFSLVFLLPNQATTTATGPGPTHILSGPNRTE